VAGIFLSEIAVIFNRVMSMKRKTIYRGATLGALLISQGYLSMPAMPLFH
jgi:hypothetical protein